MQLYRTIRGGILSIMALASNENLRSFGDRQPTTQAPIVASPRVLARTAFRNSRAGNDLRPAQKYTLGQNAKNPERQQQLSPRIGRRTDKTHKSPRVEAFCHEASATQPTQSSRLEAKNRLPRSPVSVPGTPARPASGRPN